MKPDRVAIWREADRLFQQWLEIDRTARQHWRSTLRCDPEVARALDRLIHAETTPGAEPAAVSAILQSLLAHGDISGADGEGDDPAANPLAGRSVDNWRLIEEIGRGGMSVVYRAERIGASYRQQAAVKLLGMSLIGSSAEARFVQERQVLASLDHPHIARLIDGGVADDGTPYLVMNLVEGLRIDRWCETHAPRLRQRVELMALVCDAVAYAQRNLVVHRDIKPANILVCGDGVPVLLDFGIARLLQPESPHAATELRAHTPGYAAPEQLEGGAITTATDVYSLGLVLSKLVSGSAALPPDLANIIAMATREAPERRYPDARALAADLRRYLALQPVQASPDSFAYRVSVWLRRHRGLSASLLLAALLLAGGIAATASQAHRAQLQAERAAMSRDFLLELLAAGNLEASGGSDPRISDLIELGSTRMAEALEHAPDLRAELSMQLGNIQTVYGEYDRARVLLESALQYYEVHPADGRDLGVVLFHLGTLAIRTGDARAALDLTERALSTHPSDTASDLRYHASLLPLLASSMIGMGRRVEAQQRLARMEADAPERYRQPAARANLLHTKSMLEDDPNRQAAMLEEIVLLHESLELAPATRMAQLIQLGLAQARTGDVSEGLANIQRGTELADSMYPKAHVMRARAYGNLASVLAQAGRYAEAVVASAETVSIWRALGEGTSPAFAALINNRSVLLRDLGHLEEAADLTAETVVLARELFGDADKRVASSMASLMVVRADLGRNAALEADLRTCFDVADAAESPDARKLCHLAGAAGHIANDEPHEALAQLEGVRAVLATDSPARPVDRLRLALYRGRALALLGQYDEAMAVLQAGLSHQASEADELRRMLWQLHAALGETALRAGAAAAAALHFEHALDEIDRIGLDEHPTGDRMRGRLAFAKSIGQPASQQR